MQRRNFIFGLSDSASKGDIRFNELLFNPLPGDPDYIELYNCSEKIIDVSRLQVISVNDATGVRSSLYPVSGEERLIMPGTVYAFTSDKDNDSQ